MTQHTFHLSELNRHPLQRMAQHGMAALDGASALFSWLPPGDAASQIGSLTRVIPSNKRKDQAAIEAWANLVRAHALDFHADAGEGGTRWQYAIADAWETWFMLREKHVEGIGWPWRLGVLQFIAQGTLDDMESMDPHRMQFGGGQDDWKRADMSDWRRGVARMSNEQACTDAFLIAQAWPKVDLPSLALAVGALWAIALPGWVMGARQMQMGGMRGRECIVVVDWI